MSQLTAWASAASWALEVSRGERDASPNEGLAWGHSEVRTQASLSEAAGRPSLSLKRAVPLPGLSMLLPRPCLLACLHSCASTSIPPPAPTPLGPTLAVVLRRLKV